MVVKPDIDLTFMEVDELNCSKFFTNGLNVCRVELFLDECSISDSINIEFDDWIGKQFFLV